MNRRNFIKLTTTEAIVITIFPPRVLSQKEDNGYYCALYFQGKELTCKSYTRVYIKQQELFKIKNGSLMYNDIPDSVFNLYDTETVQIDEIKICKLKDNFLQISYKQPNGYDTWPVHNGVFTVKWN